ncbi:hypothetical protein C1645_780741, partial [Glomus cerebriforme]
YTHFFVVLYSTHTPSFSYNILFILHHIIVYHQFTPIFVYFDLLLFLPFVYNSNFSEFTLDF